VRAKQNSEITPRGAGRKDQKGTWTKKKKKMGRGKEVGGKGRGEYSKRELDLSLRKKGPAPRKKKAFQEEGTKKDGKVRSGEKNGISTNEKTEWQRFILNSLRKGGRRSAKEIAGENLKKHPEGNNGEKVERSS